MNDVLMMEKLHASYFAPNCPVMITKIPRPIMNELDVWVKESRRFKDSPLSSLKAHENVGYSNRKKHNTYQCSVPTHLVENSFWLAWTLRLAAKYWGMGKDHRHFKLRKWDGHFDGYDIWTNFSYKGDDNPEHNHAGLLSGVIYYKNHKHPTIFTEYSHPTYSCECEGPDGHMIMFPSRTLHMVNPQMENKERITLAFNLVANNEFPALNA